MNPDKIDEIAAFHRIQKEKIEARLADFRRIWAEGSDRDLFAELAFCILTPPVSGEGPAGPPSSGSEAAIYSFEAAPKVEESCRTPDSVGGMRAA